jgi:hypothetical protein
MSLPTQLCVLDPKEFCLETIKLLLCVNLHHKKQPTTLVKKIQIIYDMFIQFHTQVSDGRPPRDDPGIFILLSALHPFVRIP